MFRPQRLRFMRRLRPLGLGCALVLGLLVSAFQAPPDTGLLSQVMKQETGVRFEIDESMTEVLERAIEAYRRSCFLAGLNDDFAALRRVRSASA